MFNIRLGTARQCRGIGPLAEDIFIASGNWYYFGPGPRREESQIWQHRTFAFRGLRVTLPPQPAIDRVRVSFEELAGPSLDDSLSDLYADGGYQARFGTPSAQVIYREEGRVLVFGDLGLTSFGTASRHCDERRNVRFLATSLLWANITGSNGTGGVTWR